MGSRAEENFDRECTARGRVRTVIAEGRRPGVRSGGNESFSRKGRRECTHWRSAIVNPGLYRRGRGGLEASEA